MKRADRRMQIQRLTMDVEKQRQIARTLSRQPLALIKKHPVVTLLISVVALGAATRIAVATPVSTAIKILGLPLLRQVASNALLMISQTQQE
ncbi:hypothetical protein E3V39_09500 [Gammaproteobacteria bacterium LSUCC0112]|nr:hypothetical protein E3V39_09500 [Gammaproteobacteria bacterium LSUCC0112]